MSLSFPSSSTSNYTGLNCHTGALYYNSTDPYDKSKKPVYGRTFDIGAEQNIVPTRDSNILHWGLNIEFMNADQQEYGTFDSYEESLSILNTSFEASYKTKTDSEFYIGPLLGYTRLSGSYKSSYEHGIDTDSDGMPDTIYTSPKNSFSFTENILRAGMDINIGKFNIKPYYNYNISYNDTYSGPGLELSWGNYGVMPYLKISTTNGFNRMTNFDLGINLLFFDIGIKSTVSGNEKVPELAYGYFGIRARFN